MVSWWRNWETLKTLPFDGELGDQPAYVAEVIRLCADSLAEVQHEQMRAHNG
jgi:hypothetical protein